MSRKVIIAVAPVKHPGSEMPPGCRNPETAEDIAREVIDCARAGAAMVHLHVRDEHGVQTAEMDVFARTLDLIRAESDIIIQGSTGGVSSLSLEERCVSLNDPRVEVASLNMGSCNFGDGVYINTLPDVRFWAKRMQETETVPELDYRLVDSDNHYYETRDCFTRFMEPAHRDKAIRVVSDGDREQIMVGDRPFTFLSNYHFDTAAKPGALRQMLRIGRRCIVSFPNFVYWKPVLQMLLTGRTPVTENLPFRWYNSPNLHHLTIRDFEAYCRESGAQVLKSIALKEGRRRSLRFLPSVRAEEAIFVIADRV